MQTKEMMNPFYHFNGYTSAYAPPESVSLSQGNSQLLQSSGNVQREASHIFQEQFQMPSCALQPLTSSPQPPTSSLQPPTLSQLVQGSSTFPGVPILQPLGEGTLQVLQNPLMSTGDQSFEEQQTASLQPVNRPLSLAGMPSLQSSEESSQEISSPVEYFSRSELTQIFMKSCSRKNMAVLMTRKLFTEEVRMSSNVSGRNKIKLNPQIMDFIRKKLFLFFQVLNLTHLKNGQNVL